MFSKTDIEKYFNAEKRESLVFMIVGIIAISVSLFMLLFYVNHFTSGLVIPLVVIALIQLLVGYTVYTKSDKQRTDNTYAYDLDLAYLKNIELPRMEVVMKNFVIYKWVEIVLTIAGISLIICFANMPTPSFWNGLGVGLTVQSIFMLALDLFAEKRGRKYLQGLKSFLSH